MLWKLTELPLYNRSWKSSVSPTIPTANIEDKWFCLVQIGLVMPVWLRLSKLTVTHTRGQGGADAWKLQQSQREEMSTRPDHLFKSEKSGEFTMQNSNQIQGQCMFVLPHPEADMKLRDPRMTLVRLHSQFPSGKWTLWDQSFRTKVTYILPRVNLNPGAALPFPRPHHGPRPHAISFCPRYKLIRLLSPQVWGDRSHTEIDSDTEKLHFIFHTLDFQRKTNIGGPHFMMACVNNDLLL